MNVSVHFGQGSLEEGLDCLGLGKIAQNMSMSITGELSEHGRIGSSRYNAYGSTCLGEGNSTGSTDASSCAGDENVFAMEVKESWGGDVKRWLGHWKCADLRSPGSRDSPSNSLAIEFGRFGPISPP